MSLQSCRECAADVAIGAAACPHCGAAEPAKDAEMYRKQQISKAVEQLLLAFAGLCATLGFLWFLWHIFVP